MCGTGVTAVILKFAIECILKLNVPVRVYDGSWTEWASRAPSEYIQKIFKYIYRERYVYNSIIIVNTIYS